MKPHIFHGEAEVEYAEAAQYYAGASPRLAGRFYDEIERLIAEVCAKPQLYRLHYPPVRRHFTNVFPYGILYAERQTEVWIVAVMHLHRDLNYWLSRLE